MDDLAGFLGRQRWFAGKARELAGVRVVDSTRPGDLPDGLVLSILEVRYADGGAERYAAPLPRRDEGDHAATERLAAWMLEGIGSGAELPTERGRIRCRPTGAFASMRGEGGLSPRVLSGEQSNTSVRYGDRLIAKVFRRLQPGENPEAEIGRFLTERTTFDRAPRTAGTVDYEAEGAEPSTLAIVQEFVRSDGVAWELVLAEVREFYRWVEERLERAGKSAGSPAERAALRLIVEHDAAHGPAEGSMRSAERLGERTAQLHRALGSSPGEPAFAPEPFEPADLDAVAAGASEQLREVVALIGRRLGSLDEATRRVAEDMVRSSERGFARLAEFAPLREPAVKIRCHGDYHLGQVLRTGDDYFLLDFEGEPAKSLAERRRKHAPIKDVVGMLRSYDYAAFAGLFAYAEGREGCFERLEPAARGWSANAGAAFTIGYEREVWGGGLYPADPDDANALIDLYTLDKALYELAYELNNRPDWVRIPLRAVAGLLQEGGLGVTYDG